MLLTESEAKTKECRNFAPASVTTVIGNGEHRTTTVTDAFHKCSASACMKWRWFHAINVASDADSKGYCGLAGKPWEGK